MADIDIVNVCLAAIENLADADREALTSGKIGDWPHYRYHLGRLQALEAAERDIKEALRKRYDQDEDE